MKGESIIKEARPKDIHPADNLVNKCFGGRDYNPVNPSMVVNRVDVAGGEKGLMLVLNESAVKRAIAALRAGAEAKMADALQMGLDVPGKTIAREPEISS